MDIYSNLNIPKNRDPRLARGRQPLKQKDQPKDVKVLPPRRHPMAVKLKNTAEMPQQINSIVKMPIFSKNIPPPGYPVAPMQQFTLPPPGYPPVRHAKFRKDMPPPGYPPAKQPQFRRDVPPPGYPIIQKFQKNILPPHRIVTNNQQLSKYNLPLPNSTEFTLPKKVISPKPMNMKQMQARANSRNTQTHFTKETAPNINSICKISKANSALRLKENFVKTKVQSSKNFKPARKITMHDVSLLKNVKPSQINKTNKTPVLKKTISKQRQSSIIKRSLNKIVLPSRKNPSADQQNTRNAVLPKINSNFKQQPSKYLQRQKLRNVGFPKQMTEMPPIRNSFTKQLANGYAMQVPKEPHHNRQISLPCRNIENVTHWSDPERQNLLFIRDLRPDISHHAVFERFCAFGQIKRIKLYEHSADNLCASIHYESEESLNFALAANPHMLGNKHYHCVKIGLWRLGLSNLDFYIFELKHHKHQYGRFQPRLWKGNKVQFYTYHPKILPKPEQLNNDKTAFGSQPASLLLRHLQNEKKALEAEKAFQLASDLHRKYISKSLGNNCCTFVRHSYTDFRAYRKRPGQYKVVPIKAKIRVTAQFYALRRGKPDSYESHYLDVND